jgi:hypothetical protein
MFGRGSQGHRVSELVRQAVREKYRPVSGRRLEAMQAWIGVRKERRDLPETEAYIRRLRRGKRLQRIAS